MHVGDGDVEVLREVGVPCHADVGDEEGAEVALVARQVPHARHLRIDTWQTQAGVRGSKAGGRVVHMAGGRGRAQGPPKARGREHRRQVMEDKSVVTHQVDCPCHIVNTEETGTEVVEEGSGGVSDAPRLFYLMVSCESPLTDAPLSGRARRGSKGVYVIYTQPLVTVRQAVLHIDMLKCGLRYAPVSIAARAAAARAGCLG